MSRPLILHPDRLLPPDPGVRALARSLYGHVRDLPIISPHGHTDPGWFAYNEPFGDAVDLLLAPDHYLYRMLYSQGVSLDQLGVRSRQGAPAFEPRTAWRQFASHYKLFRGTPSALWLDQVFAEVFGLTVRLEAETADFYFDAIGAALGSAARRSPPSAPRQPITAIRAARPQICLTGTRKPCSVRSSWEASHPKKPNCSARRCSPRWRG